MEITISAAAVAAVRFLPILPKDVRSKQSSLYPQWSRRAVVFVGGALSLIIITVVLLLQPMTQAGATKSPLTSAQIQAPQRASCLPCHQDPQALAAAGVAQDEMDRLTIVPQPPETAHGRLDCVTCHYGDGATEDLEAAHRDIVKDPTVDDGGLFVACHSELPEEFPQDRLRTPHDEVSHGQLADVSCSDCHGGVGHGFDPVSGEIICPMAVCLDCHISRQLDSELTDCDARHISAHDAVPSIKCNQCHQSTEVWTEVGTETHPLELVGRHAEAPCLDCHRGLNLAEATHCVDCHQPPSDSHYGAQCEDCHTPTSFQEAKLLDHPIPLEGEHQRAACADCHTEGQQAPEYVCSECHQPPENHLSGPCTMCHTPEGWTSSTAFITNLAPQISHALEGQEDCLMCHDPAGEIRPTPSNHGDHTNAQCVLCHKVAP